MDEEIFNFEELNLTASSLQEIGLLKSEEEKEKTTEEELETKSEEEKEKENNKTDEDKSKSPSSEDDSSTFSVFANVLKEEGVFNLPDEDLANIKTAKDLADAVKREIEESKFSNLTESQKRYLEAVEAGVPLKDFEVLEKQISSLETLKNTELDSEGKIQERFDLIAYDFISKGFSEERAVELANRSVKLGTDIEDAKEALDNLIRVKAEEYKKIVSEKKEESKISLEKIKETIDSKESILKDIKITPKQKEALYDLLTLKVDTDEQGRPLNEFNKWRRDNGLEAEIILGTIYQMTNKFQNLGKMMDVSKTKASQELEEKLRDSAEKRKDVPIKLGNGTFELDV